MFRQAEDQSFLFLEKAELVLEKILKMQSNILYLLTGEFCTFTFTVIDDLFRRIYRIYVHTILSCISDIPLRIIFLLFEVCPLEVSLVKSWR